ncbi:MAG TPA: hypothetical protein VEN99_04370 [Acidimicrobiia bacterium]|nr:hypothetical protein [Acidimicrobiia bacterium]
MADPAGDTFVDGTNDPITESRADIVRTAAGYGPGGITFTMQVQTPGDPRQDKKWSSASTFVDWAVDTNGDGQPDYEIQYSLDAGTLGGDVSRPGDETGATLCNVSAATYGADGYSITVDPACLGNPGSFSYRTTMYYDTNPKDDNADVASDVAPNGGMSFPIARPRP